MEIKAKHEKLNMLGGLCIRMGSMLRDEDMQPLIRLENLLNEMA